MLSYLWIDQTDLIQQLSKSTTAVLALVNGLEARVTETGSHIVARHKVLWLGFISISWNSPFISPLHYWCTLHNKATHNWHFDPIQLLLWHPDHSRTSLRPKSNQWVYFSHCLLWMAQYRNYTCCCIRAWWRPILKRYLYLNALASHQHMSRPQRASHWQLPLCIPLPRPEISDVGWSDSHQVHTRYLLVDPAPTALSWVSLPCTITMDSICCKCLVLRNAYTQHTNNGWTIRVDFCLVMSQILESLPDPHFCIVSNGTLCTSCQMDLTLKNVSLLYLQWQEIPHWHHLNYRCARSLCWSWWRLEFPYHWHSSVFSQFSCWLFTIVIFFTWHP